MCIKRLFHIVVWLIMLIMLALVVVHFVEAATHTHTVNMSIDNNTIEIVTPDTTFQTTCGQQFDKQFVIVHNYDEEIFNYFYYNTTYNYTINKQCECEDNCTILYNFTFTDDNSNHSFADIMGLTNATFKKCADVKSVCYDLLNANITYKVNVSAGDVRGDINKSLTKFRDDMITSLFTDEQKCLSYKDSYERCYQIDLPRCQDNQNITAVQLQNNQRWMWVGWFFALFFFVIAAGMMVVFFGRAKPVIPIPPGV